MQKKHGRHTAAFLLLFLNQAEAYGAQLLDRMQTELPYCFTDSGDVYRCLADMEKDGHIESRWETLESGQPRKWFNITASGRQALAEQAEDIRKRQENFNFFQQHYENH